MKKLVFILLCLTFVLGLTSCKKKKNDDVDYTIKCDLSTYKEVEKGTSLYNEGYDGYVVYTYHEEFVLNFKFHTEPELDISNLEYFYENKDGVKYTVYSNNTIVCAFSKPETSTLRVRVKDTESEFKLMIYVNDRTNPVI